MRISFKGELQRLFDGDVVEARSPGRINIIGEHTDYNEGFVLPAAINKGVHVAAGKRVDEKLCLYAVNFDDSHEASLSSLSPSQKGWPNYILGVVDQFKKARLAFSGFNLVVDGDVPLGAGLSSSAAVECATAFALNELFSLGLQRMNMVAMAQRAEHSFAGVKCGTMDQFASMMGKKDHVMLLDCRTNDHEYVPLDLGSYQILLLNTNVKHSLASSEYNTRRQQCEQGVRWIGEYYPEVKALRDASVEMLQKCVEPRDALVYRRCKYVVEENRRVLDACEDLRRGDLAALGDKMFQTHEGLSKDYDVSCPELDFMVDAVRNNPDVLGSRMMGGGFGGCTINLVKKEATENLVASVKKSYKAKTGRELTAYVVRPEDGSEVTFTRNTKLPYDSSIQIRND